MKTTTPEFNKEQLLELLEKLNGELQKEGITGEICIVGGAAMALGFGNRTSTRDIDALLVDPASIRTAVRKVAEQEQIPSSWLNDGAKGFASTQPFESKELLKLSNLRVVSPPAEYILAMKCISARVGVDENDKADVKFLIQHLGLDGCAAVLKIVGKYYEEKRIPAKTQYFVQEIYNELSAATDIE